MLVEVDLGSDASDAQTDRPIGRIGMPNFNFSLAPCLRLATTPQIRHIPYIDKTSITERAVFTDEADRLKGFFHSSDTEAVFK
jgi:hypothetical protein